MMKRILLAFVGLVLAFLSPHIYRYFNVMGYHRLGVTNIHPGSCTPIPGTENGSEDIELLPGDKMLISSGYLVGDGPPGNVLIADLTHEYPTAVRLPIKGNNGLHLNPLGISKWVDPNTGRITIFVTNYNGTTMTAVVERFLLSEDFTVLTYLETIGTNDPNMKYANGVTAVGERQFYFTNIFGNNTVWETSYFLPWGTVGFYDGNSIRIVADGMAGPNGIGVSPDCRYVYVNVYFDRMVRTFEMKEDHSLLKLHDYVQPMAPDNLLVDNNGDLWVAGHPITWKMFKSFANRTFPVPSHVVHLSMKGGKMTSSRDIFVDDGKLHSGSSVAMKYKKKLILGSVLREAQICNMDSQN